MRWLIQVALSLWIWVALGIEDEMSHTSYHGFMNMNSIGNWRWNDSYRLHWVYEYELHLELKMRWLIQVALSLWIWVALGIEDEMSHTGRIGFMNMSSYELHWELKIRWHIQVAFSNINCILRENTTLQRGRWDVGLMLRRSTPVKVGEWRTPFIRGL